MREIYRQISSLAFGPAYLRRAARVQEESIRTDVANLSIDMNDNDNAVARYPTAWAY